MTGLFLGGLLLIIAGGLAMLVAAAVSRATRGIGRQMAASIPMRPGPVVRPPESANSIATRLCHTLAVQAAEMREGAVTYTEWISLAETRRIEVRQREVYGETAYVVLVMGAVRHVVPDLHAVELALVVEIQRWRRIGSVDGRTGVVMGWP
jgi:hypothetical protein